MDVLLEKNVNKQIQEFIGNTSYLFTGVICKEWKYSITNTSFSIVTTSISRLEEFIISGGIVNKKLFTEALKNDNIEVTKKIFDIENFIKPWDFDMAIIPVKNGNLELLMFLKKNGCPWSRHICSEAASNGHLHILRWARSEDCPWDSKTCTNAAENGHLEVLKWLRSEGCPWYEWVCSSTASNGHLEVLKWLKDNGCPE